MPRGIRSQLLGLVLATVLPFAVLVGAGLWNQFRGDQAAAIDRALMEARLLAGQVDDHIGNLEFLMEGLTHVVSTDAADTAANDVLLRQVRSQLPGFVGNILLFSLDGTNIGTSGNTAIERPHGRDRAYFHKVLRGARLSIGDVVRARPTGDWVVTIGRPIEDRFGQLRAVLAVSTLLEHFQDALKKQRLPAGSIVRIVTEPGIVVSQSVNGPHAIGSDISGSASVARHLAAKSVSEVATWPDGIDRITGSSSANRVPWLVSVGLPTETAFAAVVARLRWGAFVSVGAVIAAFAIAWMVSGHIVRPLRQLGKDASVLAAGDFGHRTAIRTEDEVGDLAATFNRMAESIERRQEETVRAAEEMRQTKDTLSAVIDASPVAIVCSTPDRRIILWSNAAERIFGYTAEEAVGRAIKTVPPEEMAGSADMFRRALAGETIRDVQLRRMRKDGSLVDVQSTAARLHNPDGTVRGVAWVHQDVTDRVKADEQLRRLAHYDQLTGLPNRLSLQRELVKLLDGDGAKPTSVALFDLDGFKDVNDTLGHSTGDALLIAVGRRLIEVADSTGRECRVCRLGGDEFVVVVAGCGDPLIVVGIVESMLRGLAEPFNINNHVLHLGASAGVATAPADGTTADELIANADLALYQAKSDGGNTCRLFLPVLRAQAQARRDLDGELRKAFDAEQFELYFQPQIRLADNALIGAEALLRWRHPVRGVLAPGAFIEALADSVIAPEVGRWIIRTACEKAAAWRGMGLRRIGVNLFQAQLHDDGLVGAVESSLRETGLSAGELELEITENVALHRDDAMESLQKLKELGVRIAFDDFGTGYAALSYLTRFPLSRIKIDRSFVGRIMDDAKDAAIVRSLIVMAHNLGLGVIAEGVETNAQAAFLAEEGCDEVQGFLYAKPLPSAEFETYLAMWQPSGRTARPAAERSSSGRTTR